MEEHRENVRYSHSTQTTSSSDRGFSEFLHTAASAMPSGGGATSSPPSGDHSAAAGRKKPSPGEILSSAKVIVDAAKAKMHHGEDQASEAQRIDKAKVAAAAGDILSAAKHYGKLDEKNYGKYVQKAEEYLHSYNGKHSTEGVAVNSSTPTPPSHSSAQTTHEENKYGKYFKKAEEYLNKH